MSDEFRECVERCKEKCKNLYEPDELDLFNVGCIVVCMDRCAKKAEN
jgi:hypothetical protein